MRPWILLPFLALSLPSLGCLSAVYDEDSDAMLEDEPRSELPPQPLPLEGSATAFGMLRVANELGMAALDRDVGLDRRSARSILAYRAGADGYIGTHDDLYLSDIASLDALYWLGDANLWAIQSYALQEGYVVDELPRAACAPELVEAIDGCLRFTEHEGHDIAPLDVRVSSCLVQSSPQCPSSAYFADAGGVDHDDPMLGHHALLCDRDDAPEMCELGVAGIAAHLAPHCDAMFDPS